MSLGEGSTYLFIGEGTQLELWRWNLPSSSTNALYLHLAWGVRNRAKNWSHTKRTGLACALWTTRKM